MRNIFNVQSYLLAVKHILPPIAPESTLDFKPQRNFFDFRKNFIQNNSGKIWDLLESITL